MYKFNELSQNELMDVDGGAIPIVILMALALSGGFGGGYALSRWLG